MQTHNFIRDSKGQGMDQSVTPICSCGWKGYAEEAHNDYMYTNLKEQEEKHIKDALFFVEKLATEFCDQYMYKQGTKTRREAHNAFCVGFSFGKKFKEN
jgi:hypothetical protein